MRLSDRKNFVITISFHLYVASYYKFYSDTFIMTHYPLPLSFKHVPITMHSYAALTFVWKPHTNHFWALNIFHSISTFHRSGTLLDEITTRFLFGWIFNFAQTVVIPSACINPFGARNCKWNFLVNRITKPIISWERNF